MSAPSSRMMVTAKVVGDTRLNSLTRMGATVEGVRELVTSTTQRTEQFVNQATQRTEQFVDQATQKVDACLAESTRKLDENLQTTLGNSSKLVEEMKIFIATQIAIQKKAQEDQLQNFKLKEEQAQRDHDRSIVEFKLKDDLARKTHEDQVKRLIDESRVAQKKSQDDATQARKDLKDYTEDQRLKDRVGTIFGLSTAGTVLTVGSVIGAATGSFPFIAVLSASAVVLPIATAAGRVFHRSIYNAFIRCTSSSCCNSGCTTRCSNSSCCDAASKRLHSIRNSCCSTQGTVSRVTPPVAAITASIASAVAAPPSPPLLLSPAATTAAAGTDVTITMAPASTAMLAAAATNVAARVI